MGALYDLPRRTRLDLGLALLAFLLAWGSFFYFRAAMAPRGVPRATCGCREGERARDEGKPCGCVPSNPPCAQPCTQC